jgi:hypothetical protein
LAYPLAGTAAAAVVVVVVIALIDPEPGRHVRGLLVLLALTALLAVACGWARTVWHGPPDAERPVTEHPVARPPEAESPEAESSDAKPRGVRPGEPRQGASQDLRHVE